MTTVPDFVFKMDESLFLKNVITTSKYVNNGKGKAAQGVLLLRVVN